EFIAQYPVENRSDSRLLYLQRKTGKIEHHHFRNIIDLLRSDDVLVVNKTRVIPARLLGNKTTGARVEIFLLNQLTEDTWECLVKPGRKLSAGTQVIISDSLNAVIGERCESGNREVIFSWQGNFWQNLETSGNMPLPPYIRREAVEKDKETYQTIYAQDKGSVAAPTAGLHFTSELLDKIRAKGIDLVEVILHVGLGTFRPVQTDNITDHTMHRELCRIDPASAELINRAKKTGRRIIAVGTTTTRTLESFTEEGILTSGEQWTELFIHPGKKFQMIDGLLTNFHMPESTLLMLVSAFAGYENTMNAYRTAVAEKYRFFSYGDAMLIL
ncbi:MAG: tRNA preQ1(34) S-adenosylmethionine ribosyltransferase-isomerase QueA, partial [Candidatus Cloacimonetes bacterium]|nr:tRNA preQ1(34) S-adenosylmethionine ribosyltransferase-isomerase QueA [Candidatus Cloacimonadota bacterium]